MNSHTITILRRVLTEQYGFITHADMPALADDATRNLPTLLRYQDGRTVMPLRETVRSIDNNSRNGNLRDVSFPSDTARRLASELGVEIGAT